MTAPEIASPEKSQQRRWLQLIGACVAFGMLLELRENSSSLWLRAAIAATAFVVLGFGYRALKKAR